MGTKYSSVTVSGYNSAPPSDDGSATASNQVKWSTIKTKLPDPLKTAIEAINTAIVAHIDPGPSSITTNYTTVASDNLKVLSCSAGVNISLGDAASMTAGYMVCIKNGSSSGNVTVAPITTADTLNGVASTSIVVSAQMATWFICNGSGYITTSGWLGKATAPSSQVLWDPSNLTTSRTYAFPDSAGTLALTTDNLLHGYISGFTMAPNGSSNSLASIGLGTATDVSDTCYISLAGAITGPGIAAPWATGNGANKLDTGSIAANTWYHVFVIKNTTSGTSNPVDVLFSTSATAPSLPTGYTKFRRIGSVQTNASSFIRRFIQRRDTFLWETPVLDINVAAPGTSIASRTLTVPSGVRTEAICNVYVLTGTGSSQTNCYIHDADCVDQQASLTASPLFTIRANDTYAPGAQVRTWADTTSSIYTRNSFSDGNVSLKIATIGYVDQRGDE